MPTANGNVMNFSSVSSFETYTDDEDTWSNLHSIATQSSTLTTLAEQEETDVADTLYPEFLREVLNTDNIFQIGSYLIKIDLLNDRGLMIASSNANAYSSLVNNDQEAAGMMVLDGDEDFGLELLESLESNTITPSEYKTFLAERACGGARRRKEANIEKWLETNEVCDEAPTVGRTYSMDNKVVYQKAIFYFSLQAKIRSVWRCTFGGNQLFIPMYYFVDTKLTGTVKYRRRCQTEVNNNVVMEEGYFGGGNGILDWRAYSGGRSLSHYDFNVDFAIRESVDRTPTPPPYIPSIHYRIYWGY